MFLVEGDPPPKKKEGKKKVVFLLASFSSHPKMEFTRRSRTRVLPFFPWSRAQGLDTRAPNRFDPIVVAPKSAGPWGRQKQTNQETWLVRVPLFEYPNEEADSQGLGL